MVLGRPQFIFTRHDNVEYVFLCHHPLEWFKDRTDAEQYLFSRARLLLFGHEHRARISTVSIDGRAEYLIVDAGATNPSEEGGPYNYSFNWVKFIDSGA